MTTPVDAAFVRRIVTIAPGDRRPYDDAEWRGALVVIVRGEVELECNRGGSRHFDTGAVMCLEGLGLVALYNPHPIDVVLVTITRS